MYTTLNQIRKSSLDTSGWKKLLTTLEKTQADDAPLSILTVLDSNGVQGALWCLRTVEGHGREIRLYMVWCARQVQHLMKDKRSLKALDVAEAFANGLVTLQELQGAADAAYAAAADAAYAAADTAYAYAAYAAAYAAAADAAAARNRMRQKQEIELRRICSHTTVGA